ncbi:hypothetical protein DICPUDRAFT_153665 [Dictyostelium purpureum]|uniref:EGF-like domain-containing protein n=1 Tax=Dictyostelium purpureum TaxID=5786 RepID=F0ZPG4_DICPU|nr:uncharacterized protein DICPUDRAFT_153665 [Dictyostelium purpureum]EGC34151.1 hypothetical protein DICPUDRAFT_153665 [Dictyostelium purpureum]|eukprot:XP_003289305.1 hypothetical protein DICPUDRAFT_153665 [Dictyostelium purpureum]
MKLITSLFFLFLSINFIYSVEDACFSNLMGKINDTRLQGTTTPAQACSKNIYLFSCDSNGYFTEIGFNDINTVKNTISWSDISCFSKVSSINLGMLKLSENFLSEINRPIQSLRLDGTNIVSINNPIPVVIQRFSIDTLLSAKASCLKNVISLSVDDKKDFNLVVDGNQTDSNFKSFTFATSNVPDLSNFSFFQICNLKFFLPVNMSTMPNLDIFLKKFFGNEIKLLAPNYIDLSNNVNTRNVYRMLMSFGYGGLDNKFNVDGNFPFIALPKNFRSAYIDVFYGNFSTVPDLNIFKDYGTIDKTVSFRNCKIGGALPQNHGYFKGIDQFIVLGNNLSGTFDKSWCTGVSLDISNNKFSGELPKCVFCYLFYLTFIFLYHIDTITPSIKITANYTSYLYFNIVGENLGYDISNIVTVPNIFPTYSNLGDTIKGSLYFSPSDNIIKKINMTIVSLNLTYTLSISNTPPIIYQMTQYNDTLIFTGEYFAYNTSEITITIDNYQECHVIRSTFYSVVCVLDKQLRDDGLRPTNITVNGLTTIADFEYKYISYPCLDCFNVTNGYCNTINATCECYKGYTSAIGYGRCGIPRHYISAVVPVPSKTGGNLVFLGWFGSIHDNLSIKIDKHYCEIDTINSKVIICSIGSGSGIQSITMTQNNLESQSYFTPYYEPVRQTYFEIEIEDKSILDVWTSINFPTIGGENEYVSPSNI